VFYSIKSVNTDATVFNIDPISGNSIFPVKTTDFDIIKNERAFTVICLA